MSATDWSAWDDCAACGVDAGQPCDDLRFVGPPHGHQTGIPHLGRRLAVWAKGRPGRHVVAEYRELTAVEPLSLAQAAQRIGMTPDALRLALKRAARRAA